MNTPYAGAPRLSLWAGLCGGRCCKVGDDGERLPGGKVELTPLANTIATGAALVALILAFGQISAAHLNRAGTPADALEHGAPHGVRFQYRLLHKCADDEPRIPETKLLPLAGHFLPDGACP